MQNVLALLRSCLVVLALIQVSATGEAVASGADSPSTIYGFDEAVQHGVVDFVVNPWAKVSYDGILANLKEIHPGLVNRLSFQYGGMTLKKLDYTGDMARRIHEILPEARIGGGFPENLKADYSEALPCDNETDMEKFCR